MKSINNINISIGLDTGDYPYRGIIELIKQSNINVKL